MSSEIDKTTLILLLACGVIGAIMFGAIVSAVIIQFFWYFLIALAFLGGMLATKFGTLKTYFQSIRIKSKKEPKVDTM